MNVSEESVRNNAKSIMRYVEQTFQQYGVRKTLVNIKLQALPCYIDLPT